MKLDFKYIEKALLDYNAKSELKQASIIMVRNIFKQAETKQCDIPVVSQQRELLERLDKLENWAYNKANEDDLKFLNSIYRSENCC